MNKLAILLFACSAAWGYQSLSVPAGSTVNCSIPNSAPFNSLGDNMEALRIDSLTFPVSGGLVTAINCGAFLIQVDSSHHVCVAFSDSDNQSDYGNQACGDGTGASDFLIRFQRFGNTFPSNINGTSPGSTVFELWNAATGASIVTGCSTSGANVGFQCPIAVATSSNVSGGFGWGNAGVSFHVAYWKWFSTTVQPGTPFTETEGVSADLADFTFEGVYTNAAGGGITMSAGTGSPTFVASISEHPFCQISSVEYPFQVLRVGQLQPLINNSFSLNGTSSLTYAWSQIAGSHTATFSSTTAAAPFVIAPARDSYTFQLVPTDTSSQTSTCSVKDGAVRADANGVVDTENPQINALLGSIVIPAANQWAYFEHAMRVAESYEVPNLATYYTIPAAGPGTITVTNSSATVTGSSTTFLATFCGGSAGAATTGAALVVRYLVSAVVHYRWMNVSSCASNTSLTLAQAWNVMGNLPTQSAGLAYNYDNDCGSCGGQSVWINNSKAPNFYDAVIAFYSDYFRTGIDTYLTAARTLADNFWLYRMDQGNNFFPGDAGFGDNGELFPRNWSLAGIILRALDGQSAYWSGIEQVATYAYGQMSGHLPWAENGWDAGIGSDARETAYSIKAIADVIRFDPNATNAAAFKLNLSNLMTNGVFPSVDTVTGTVGQTLYWANSGGGTPGSDSWSTGTHVTLTNGSPTATLVGGTWTSGLFASTFPFIFTTVFTTTPGDKRPTNTTQYDAGVYCPIFVDSTHATLQDCSGTNKNWAGTSGSYGWAAAFWLVAPYSTNGITFQPYMAGIAASSMYSTGMALTCPGTNCDATNSARAFTYLAANANWLRTQGFNSTSGGMNYFAGGVNCVAPVPYSNASCQIGFTVDQVRALNPEGLRGVMLAFAVNRDPVLRNFGDQVMTATWGKPGFSLPAGQTSLNNLWSYGWNDVRGFFVCGPGVGCSIPTSSQTHKDWGQANGFSLNSAWPGIRIGGVIPSSLVGGIRSGASVVGN